MNIPPARYFVQHIPEVPCGLSICFRLEYRINEPLTLVGLIAASILDAVALAI